jgi:bifunctional NMN adenylyltransferase/nudix hydrolase
MSKKYQFSVFIGRFQPFHKGHLFNIQEALSISNKLILVIGSANRARTIKNPFTFDERKTMIYSDLKNNGIDISKVIIEPVVDYFYEETAWEDDVKKAVSLHSCLGDKVAIVGHDKDSSSYYLKSFPSWDYVSTENYDGLNATNLRNDLWTMQFHKLNTYLVNNKNEKGTAEFLNKFILSNKFSELVKEYEYIQQYKKSWQNTPFPAVFVTVDAVIIHKESILLIQRKNLPGKGLWAMPGGFIDKGERIKDAIIRELNEETQINVTSAQLHENLLEIKVYDYPDRSARGRTITHVGLFDLSCLSERPQVNAADDANEAKWFSINDFQFIASDMMDDHFQIINHLIKSVNIN